MLEIKQLIKILQIAPNFMTRVIRNINAKDWKSDTSCVTTEYRQGVIININIGYVNYFWCGSF
jgi:hypothetical protein